MILAGTGHRPDKLCPSDPKSGYSLVVLERLTQLAEEFFKELEPTVVISGMALGWDTALAIAATRLSIPLHAYVPFRGQELMWPSESQNRYRALLAKAAKVVVVSPSPYAAWKMQLRNVRMVDALGADGKLLALWNGTDGGTLNCLEYAKMKIGSDRIINAWDRWVIAK